MVETCCVLSSPDSQCIPISAHPDLSYSGPRRVYSSIPRGVIRVAYDILSQLIETVQDMLEGIHLWTSNMVFVEGAVNDALGTPS